MMLANIIQLDYNLIIEQIAFLINFILIINQTFFMLNNKPRMILLDSNESIYFLLEIPYFLIKRYQMIIPILKH